MPTPHNQAERGQIAGTVLMPGDPLRARMIADTFLDGAVPFNQTRGMLGYTGSYKGKRVSVMGSGMGMPSIGIYSYELFTEYDVQNIIRVGSAGAYAPQLKLFDVLLASAAWSESSYAYTMSGCSDKLIYPSDTLNKRLVESAKALDIPLHQGIIYSSDVFYRKPWQGENYWMDLRDREGCLAVEMESFALFHNASVTGKNAACLLTISDSFTSGGETTAEERQKSFTRMMEIALGIL